MNLTPTLQKVILVLLFMGLSIGLVISILSYKELKRETALLKAERTEPASAATTAKVQMQPRLEPAKPSQAPPSKPTGGIGISVVEGPDTDLIKQGRGLLRQPAGPVRLQQWAALAEKANFLELVRMTEIVAQPPASSRLDDDRLEMRRIAILYLGRRGELGEFLERRQAFDWPKISNAQELAWRELSSTDPAAAFQAWEARERRLAPEKSPARLAKLIAEGLSAGDQDKNAAAIAQLSTQRKAELQAALAGK